MKKLNRILSLSAAAALALSLTACSGGPSGTADTPAGGSSNTPAAGETYKVAVIKQMDHASLDEIANAITARLDVGLEDRMRQPVGLLSGGQRQALTLLMATMVPPKLLLLDEHTAALDPATAEKVLRLTREIVEGERITCLMITHNMKNALELGSRTFMMDAGRVVLDIGGEERKGLTVDDLLERFRAGAGKNLDNDRILLSND